MNISDSNQRGPPLQIEKVSYPNDDHTHILLGNEKYKIGLKGRETKIEEKLKLSERFFNFVLTLLNYLPSFHYLSPRQWVELHLTIDQTDHLIYVRVNKLRQALCLNGEENKEMCKLIKKHADLQNFIYDKVQQEITHLVFIEETYPSQRRLLQGQLTEARTILRDKQKFKSPDCQAAEQKVRDIEQNLTKLEKTRQEEETIYGTAEIHRFLAKPKFGRHASELFSVFKDKKPFIDTLTQFIREYDKIAPLYIKQPHASLSEDYVPQLSVIDILPFFKACLFYLQKKDPQAFDLIIRQIHSFSNEQMDLEHSQNFVYLSLLQQCLNDSEL